MSDVQHDLTPAVRRIYSTVEELVVEGLTAAAHACVERQPEVFLGLETADQVVLQANVASSIATAKADVYGRLMAFDYAARAESGANGASAHVTLDELVNPLLTQTASVLRDAGFDPGRTERTVLGPLRISTFISSDRAENALAPLNQALLAWSQQLTTNEASDAAAKQAEAMRAWKRLQGPSR